MTFDWWRELDSRTRRNLALELLFALSNGVLSGLVLISQVVAVGSLGDRGLAATVMVASQPATALFLPFWANQARKRKLQDLAIFGGILRCLPLLVVGWLDQPWQMALVVLLYYLLGGPVTLAVPSLYKYNYPDSHRGRILGLLKLVQNGITVPVLIGVALLSDREPTAYQIVYPLGGLIGLAGVFAYRLLRIPGDDPLARREKSERPTLAGMRGVLARDHKFRWFQTTIFLTGAGFLLSRGVWLFLLRDHFQLQQVTITLLVMVFPVILGGISAPAWGTLIDRTSPVAGRIAFALLGIPAYAAIFASFYTDLIWLAFLGAALRGIVLGAAEVATTTGNLYFAEQVERSALYESISSMFQGVRGIAMPPLGWLLYQASLGLGWPDASLFLFPTVLNVWSLALAVRLWQEDRRHPLPTEIEPVDIEKMEGDL